MYYYDQHRSHIAAFAVKNLSDVAMERARLNGYVLLFGFFPLVFAPFSKKNVLFVQVIYKPFCCKLKFNSFEQCNNLLNT